MKELVGYPRGIVIKDGVCKISGSKKNRANKGRTYYRIVIFYLVTGNIFY